MESLLVKIFATALALSQVTTTPDAVKTQFDRGRDQEEVARLLGAGCAHMRKAFDIEDINLDDLIATALDDPQAMSSENKAFRGINFADLQVAYRQFCKNEKVPVPAVDLGEVIDHYNKAAADLPDHTKLKGIKLPGASVVLGSGPELPEANTGTMPEARSACTSVTNSGSHEGGSMPQEAFTTSGALAGSPPGARNHWKMRWKAEAVALSPSVQPLAAIQRAPGATPMR